ncbi:hypothetical protein F2Q69_00004024 [Brassica cretica]|uniref:Uncharacterized protein n=1 Tax=Brassica cretica TaxID=69181 RepID=A0A8S9PI00_BRACR|nr:hypothetical protein F2Q69_00004024 [Brassica cretica]
MKSRAGEVLGTACEEISEDLPQMMFADGEEPVGVRALTYQSSRAINTDSEDEEEDVESWARSRSRLEGRGDVPWRCYKLDVERMREKPRIHARKKTTSEKGKALNSLDEAKIISLVSGILKPEIERVDGKVASAIASVQALSTEAILQKASVVSSVEVMLNVFKLEILSMVQNALPKPVMEKETTTPPRVTTSKVSSGANIPAGPVDANDEILQNVMANISHYSTPTGYADRVQLSNGKLVVIVRKVLRLLDFPSFDLGVTQNVRPPVAVQDDEMGDTGDKQCEERVDDPQPCRKSKMLRLVPPPLITDYQCEIAFLNRAREAKMKGSNYYELIVVREKFAKLSIILQNHDVVGLSVTGKDITDIAERTRPLPGKVFDILMRLVRSTVYNQVGSRGGKIPEFLDSRFVSLLARNYDRFRRSKSKESYVFAKGAKIYILDCNSAVRSDSQLARDLLPISDMFPVLLKSSGLLEIPGVIGLPSERIKGVAQNNNAADSALTAALLMQTHSLFGPDTCRCITPEVIGDEAHRAAVMLYEFHEKLQ